MRHSLASIETHKPSSKLTCRHLNSQANIDTHNIFSLTMAGDDPVRDLNNYLQGQPGNLTQHLNFATEKTGPDSQAKHTGTYTFRGVVVGTGEGTRKAAAKRAAAVQALQYFHAYGIPE
ncbi:hypothetical protein BJV77DRAFT_1064820 [Russula vinacea]|nr:hypothetical protein BJV77DRAFT_1064820 [Russula vinacea]